MMVMTPTGLVFIAAGLVCTVALIVIQAIRAHRERAGHNDRDFGCQFWWGDRSGSAFGVTRERCGICRPAPDPRPVIVDRRPGTVSDLGVTQYVLDCPVEGCEMQFSRPDYFAASALRRGHVYTDHEGSA